jgi:diguanylate cyclase (GGDEF)-like protein
VGRFGPRSLGFRLLVVLLVPMVGLQLFAYRELRRQRDVVHAAGEVSRQSELVRATAALIVPLYLEYTSNGGLLQADEKNFDRATLTELAGADFELIRGQAATDLDAALAAAEAAAEQVSAPTRHAVRTTLDGIRADLQVLRNGFENRNLHSVDARLQYHQLTERLRDLNDTLSSELRDQATTAELNSLGAEADQLIASLEYASDELAHLTDAGVSGDAQTHMVMMLQADGALDAALTELHELLSPARRIRLKELTSGDAFVKADTALTAFTDQIGLDGNSSVDGAADITSLVTAVLASYEQLRELDDYAQSFLQSEVSRAEAVQSDANMARRAALAVMVLTLVVSLVLLGLVMRSVLRPLRRLVRQSRQVREGDLSIETEKPTGPTDVRVVARAFNDMVTTLKAYELQLSRLATGDTKVDSTLPGPLGDTVRRSVSQLASVTAQLHASEAAAVRQARTDSLTGLANRTAALERLAVIAFDARHSGVPGAIIFLDLDGFKSVNDTQGHGEGDRILAELGERLRAACPHELVARIGGDEFVVLLEEAPSLELVVENARRLIGIVSAPCAGSRGQLFTLSASAGVSVVDGHREPLDCIAQADTAVYHAKERGRGRVEVFDERLAQVLEERAEMALTMRHGLAERQFSLRLQPIIDIASSSPIGAEVLLRWDRAGLPEIGPADFIPIAERTGVIVDLETWVLEEAVGILRDWRLDPTTARMRLAVNISGRHIVEGNLAPLLDELCRRASVDPTLIDLEITETHLVADIGRAGAVVDDLRAQGVNVAIDDFGTGYSSMSYLHRLTVDTLKIDQVFVAGMCDNRLDRTIVELLLRLGDSLGMTVVAEGVDSEEKLTLLRELGCPRAQGFHIARPMSIADGTRWLREQEALATSLR